MRRHVLTLAVAGAGLAVWASLGWDAALWDPRLQLVLHLLAALAVAGVVVLAARGGEVPRTALELPIAGLLIAFGLATLSAWNIGLSAPALAGIVATTAMLPVALVALRHRPNWTAIVVVAPILWLTAGTLLSMVERRIEWVLAGGSGWPPVRLANELTSFGPVAVPPFVILATLPVALAVTQPRLRLAMVAGLLAIGLPLMILSGSRSLWIAIAATAAVLFLSRAGKLRWVGRPSLRQLAVLLAGVGVAGVAIAFVGSRVGDTSSLTYRTRLWDATLTVWRGDPWLGIGPGAMPYARQEVAPLLQPHSHNVPLGILGDAGIVGLGAALLVFGIFAWLARPRADSSMAGKVAFAVVIGIAIGFLGEDLTFLPGFNLLLMLAAAVALLDAGAVTWRRVQLRLRVAAPALAGVAALVACGLVADAAAVSFRAGTDAAAVHDWAAAEDRLSTAVALNPLQPSGAEALAIAADWNGHPARARQMAERAVELNSGDANSWVNLAVLCLAAGDQDCANGAANSSLRASANAGLTLINAARTFAATGRPAEADAAYLASLQQVWQTSLVVQWPHPLSLGGDRSAEQGTPLQQLSLLVARRVQGEELRPASYASASIRALAFAMTGDTGSAHQALAAAIVEAPDEAITWDLVALLKRHWGEDDALALRVGTVTRGRGLAPGPARIPALTRDIAALRVIPADGLVSGAQRLLSPGPWPWVLDPLLAP